VVRSNPKIYLSYLLHMMAFFARRREICWNLDRNDVSPRPITSGEIFFATCYMHIVKVRLFGKGERGERGVPL
jgi:hypothetical protein